MRIIGLDIDDSLSGIISTITIPVCPADCSHSLRSSEAVSAHNKSLPFSPEPPLRIITKINMRVFSPAWRGLFFIIPTCRFGGVLLLTASGVIPLVQQ